MGILRARLTAFGIIGTGKETANIGIHIGIGRQGVIQTEGYLLTQHVPSGIDVTAPSVGACTLLTGEITAGENKHTFIFINGPLMIINALHGSQREKVAHRTPRSLLFLTRNRIGHRTYLIKVTLLKIQMIRIC